MTDDHSGDSTLTDQPNVEAFSRRGSVDHDAFVIALVERLSAVPGLPVVVGYQKGRIRKAVGDIPYVNDMHRSSDPIRSLKVTVGTTEYWVNPATGTLRCGIDTVTMTRGRTSDIVALAEWTDLLLEDVIRHNHLDPESGAALRNLIHGNRA
jgi:hypothetical protein